MDTQIAELEAADQIEYEEKVTAAQVRFQASRSPILEPTGITTLVKFNP